MLNSKKINRCFAMGGLGQNLVYALMSAFLFFFTEGVGLSAATIGTLLFVVRIYGLIVDPIIAVIIEKTNTKWGKYKPYIISMPPIISILLIALFFKPNLSPGTHIIYVYVVTILFWTAYAFFDIAFWSIIPDITKNENFRFKLLQSIKIASVFAIFGFGIAQMPLVDILGNGSYLKGFFLLSIILGSLFLIFGLVLSKELFSNESLKDLGLSKTSEIKDKKVKKNNKLKLSDMIKALLANSPLINVISAKLFIYTALYIKTNLLIYFYKFSLGNDKLGSFSNLIALPVTLILIAISPKLLKKYGNKKVMSYFLGISVIISFIYIINFKVSYFYIIIDGLSSAIVGMYSLVITNMVVSTVEYGEWKTNTRLESVILSTNTISSKLTSGMSAAISGWILNGIGYIPGKVQSVETLSNLHNAIVWIPVVGYGIAIIILSRYKLTSEMYNNIVKDLEIRNKESKQAC
ncbi:glycoside-pentoside-hexuronide (GPH):cation symporter [Clostridium sp. CMCC3677]|uniref:MFS transporter n=1 Tax=Clostridium sp. CMCC3677 TaxID=2949963 RepID=UPI0020797293|nr:glycoside-pentoside-hexuronide (GPH):cation symporter [Clostridium sp. CMCC3677]